MANKDNSTAAEIDLTPYNFIGEGSLENKEPTCGSCHPGGGGMEYDREGKRYDKHMEKNPGLKDSLDGDYHNSNWVQSGVVEADCLVCHQQGYNFEERVEQLKKRNYAWSSTAASGAGEVSGQVKEGETPSIDYNESMFNPDGTVNLSINEEPEDKNCLSCHGSSDLKKRGFTWNDPENIDVHGQAGMDCVDCHNLIDNENVDKMEHQIAKGDAIASSARKDLDNTVKSCRDCHIGGSDGAPVPEHESVKPSHLESLSCQACHIPELNRSAAEGFDVTTGKMVNITNVPGTESFGEKGEWEPAFLEREDGKLYPVNYIDGIWPGNRGKDGTIYPLFLSEIREGYEIYKDDLKDHSGSGVPEANTEEEITAVLETFQKTLQDNPRFEQVNPVYIKGGKVYELDDSGQLKSSEAHIAEAHGFSIDHNVAPAEMALGSGGCSDCHTTGDSFFDEPVTVDIYGSGDDRVTVSRAGFLNYDGAGLKWHTYYQEYRDIFLGIVFLGLVLSVAAHYKLVGPRGKDIILYPAVITRFNVLERIVHLVRMLSFIILFLTGLAFIFNNLAGAGFLLGTYDSALKVHWISGIIFTITSLVSIVIWCRDACFKSYDKEWLCYLGGYLGHDVHCPAHRFNAGQKIFFWFSSVFSIILAVTGGMLYASGVSTELQFIATVLHGIASVILAGAVLVHAYLGTLANPGTFRVLLDGKVSEEWAQAHHPQWYEEKNIK